MIWRPYSKCVVMEEFLWGAPHPFVGLGGRHRSEVSVLGCPVPFRSDVDLFVCLLHYYNNVNLTPDHIARAFKHMQASPVPCWALGGFGLNRQSQRLCD